MRTRTHTHTCTHAHTHTHMHTCTQTHTYTHAHIRNRIGALHITVIEAKGVPKIDHVSTPGSKKKRNTRLFAKACAGTFYDVLFLMWGEKGDECIPPSILACKYRYVHDTILRTCICFVQMHLLLILPVTHLRLRMYTNACLCFTGWWKRCVCRDTPFPDRVNEQA